MAPKRSTPIEYPPSASASSDEEETGSEEEVEEEEPEKSGGGEGEDEEEEDIVEATKTQKPLPSPPSKREEEESETESDSGTDSDSERPQAVSNSNVKPILSKPVAEKRGAEADGYGKEPKRAKKKKESELDGVDKSSSEDVKKQPFQRLWSEEDEVAVLEGLIKSGGKKGVDAVKDIAAFRESIKRDLHIDVSLTQLKDKVFRLKRKFDNNRKGELGEGKTFNKDHDQKVFDMSKRIWGSEVASEASAKSNGMVKAKAKAKANVSGSGSKVELNFDRSVGMEEYVMRKGSELMHGAKKAKMSEKLQRLHMEEIELFLKRNELVRECTKVVLSAYDNKMDEDEDE